MKIPFCVFPFLVFQFLWLLRKNMCSGAVRFYNFYSGILRPVMAVIVWLPIILFAQHILAYLYSTEWSCSKGENTIGYNSPSIRDEIVLNQSFITEGTEGRIVIPYEIDIKPPIGGIYVTDAKDYVSPGFLHCYSCKGKLNGLSAQ